MAKAKFQRWEHTGMMQGIQESQYDYSRVTSGKAVNVVRQVMERPGHVATL